ncbi:SDR family NAD(P)-dependent oxidoreductase [Microbacterium sp. AK031]|uniref:SDR family NAD(P)-dependent oxidoreductase n=1 Tax=Microbacterium sp. AK031 TaxID=2723076 RepID=UPI00216AAF78|nr:SDR family NAD(P)-dependent oxidoreductase [Microbacterium sp. AK031]MCS3843391.1 NAD(P)-dependent dehydrogenase (short-subunit alcohol dehydrogenase family) [Microbacterium sp. AK031]
MTQAAPFPDSRTAVVTGAASPRGIGRVTARRLASEGWAVAIVDLDADLSREAAESLNAEFGVPALGVAASVADEEQIRGAFDLIEAELPQIVGLVNIAGVSSPTPFLELTTAEWDQVFDVNLRGAYLATRRAAETMVNNSVGRVVSLASISAERGGGTFSKVPYSASKAGIIGFSRAVARELSPLGVTVNAISPGPIDTDIMGGTLTEERKNDLSRDVLVGRVGRPDEVAALIAFLMREEAGYITGVNYDINGGLHFS